VVGRGKEKFIEEFKLLRIDLSEDFFQIKDYAKSNLYDILQ